MHPSFNNIRNYRQVSEVLATSGQPSEADLVAIAATGYSVVINLALHTDPRYSLPDEADTVQQLGLHYLHIPVLFDAPQLSDLLAFFEAMEQHQGSKMWIHCAANMRVSVFLGLYYHLRQGQDIETAFALQRELWELNEVWQAFVTEAITTIGATTANR